MDKQNICVILPAHNEEEALGQVIKDIKQLVLRCNIVVVDSASTDGTSNVARSERIKALPFFAVMLGPERQCCSTVLFRRCQNQSIL